MYANVDDSEWPQVPHGSSMRLSCLTTAGDVVVDLKNLQKESKKPVLPWPGSLARSLFELTNLGLVHAYEIPTAEFQKLNQQYRESVCSVPHVSSDG